MIELTIPERRKALTAALRSGKYPQGRTHLCKTTCDGVVVFCCLGVASEVAIANGLDVLKIIKPNRWSDEHKEYTSYDGNVSSLPDSVMDFYGFDTSVGGFGGGSLAQLNDYVGYSFEDIADLIDSNPKGLFIN